MDYYYITIALLKSNNTRGKLLKQWTFILSIEKLCYELLCVYTKVVVTMLRGKPLFNLNMFYYLQDVGQHIWGTCNLYTNILCVGRLIQTDSVITEC